MMKISVFGGSAPQPGTPAYQEAYELGKLLGGAGMTVLTGGYTGTMEATSRGASEAGGHVIGVTCEEIEAWRPIGPNAWVAEEWRCQTFDERLNSLVVNCDAAIALPGGLGTLLEIGLTWNKLAIEVIQPKPVILLGSSWHKVMETFFAEFGDYVPMDDRQYLAFAPEPHAALELLTNFLGLA
ncbi:MAG: LOG family protein [Brevefilum sp.]